MRPAHYGYLLLASTTLASSYFVLWLIGVVSVHSGYCGPRRSLFQPFIPEDSILRSLFPSQIYALLLAAGLLWAVTVAAGISVCLKEL